MDERLSLLDDLRATRCSVSIITTYSVDFHFYEEVVLRRLNASGCERHLLLVDAERCGEALADPDRRPRLAGISYALVPIVRSGAFHPKLILLAGKKSSRLFVGSHNLTFPGFGGNAEITNSLEAPRSSANTSVLLEAITATRSWAGETPPPMVTEILDAAQALVGSAKGASEASLLVSRAGLPPLWDRLQPRLPPKPTRVILVGPFFDEGMQFVQRAMADLRAPEFIVAVDPTYSKLDPDAARATGARFVDAKPCLEQRGFATSSVLHAKAMLVESEGRTVLVSGSANPSAAAWLRPDTNAEAVLFRDDVPEADRTRLGLLELAEAPEITPSQWAALAERVRVEREAEAPEAAEALIAIEEAGAITIYGATSAPSEVRLLFADGSTKTVAPESQDGLLIIRGDAAQLSTCTLIELLGEHRAFAVVNHAAVLSPRGEGGGGARSDLRAALGAVSDDPSRLEEILKIVERAIDDVDTLEIAAGARASADPSGADTDAAPLGSRSMKLADVKRRQARPKSLATGDIAVVIDLLIRRISDGLAPAQPAALPPEVEEHELDPIEEAARVASAGGTIDGVALVKACHRKVGSMLRRMAQRLAQVMKSGTGATRATIQLAAVLGVLRWLRRLEPQLPWLPFGASLVPSAPRDTLFGSSARYLGLARPSLIEHVRAETAEDFEELTMALGLIAWLAREGDVDVRTLPRHPDKEALKAYGRVGMLVMILRHVAFDETARGVLCDAVAEGRGADREEWLAAHLRLGEAAAIAEVSSSDVPVLPRDVRRGDVVRIDMPNGRSAVGFALDLDETKIRLLDPDNDAGRPVMRTYVSALDVDAIVELIARPAV